jgi:hypothetical protein
MSRVIQPLSEHFLYCSPEAMCRDLYRQRTIPSNNKKTPQKQKAGDHHGRAKTD